MNLEELQGWIASDAGFKGDIALLRRSLVGKGLGLQNLPIELIDYEPNWQRLLLASSILSRSQKSDHIEKSLCIAHAGLLLSETVSVRDASATILTQLANSRAVDLAVIRGLISNGLSSRVGISEKIILARREIDQSISPANGAVINANRFQQEFWDQLISADWISATAPTASGKTYLVLRWLVGEVLSQRSRLAVFVAPTRALVGEIERSLIDLLMKMPPAGVRVASLPLGELGDGDKPTILVFTQERLHVFLNTTKTKIPIDLAIVDEVQKIGEGVRGVLLQEAIERLVKEHSEIRMVFLSPSTQNPETILADAPDGKRVVSIPSDLPTVTQNLISIKQVPRDPLYWALWLHQDGEHEIGHLALESRPDSAAKRVAYIAYELGREQTGTLIYANGAAEAEKIGWLIYSLLENDSDIAQETADELAELSKFVRDTVHPEYLLVQILKRGVAFHYGNMPTLLREEIERLFRNGSIRFLVCTSTLIEGVNLACKTIVVRGPRRGNNKPMQPYDFWNLAGRAGRWGQEFLGNIVCIDTQQANLWPHGLPQKVRYPIKRETDRVLERPEELLSYIQQRTSLDTATIDPEFEYMLAYLMSLTAQNSTIFAAPAMKRVPAEYLERLELGIANLMTAIDIPHNVIVRHSGISAVALQALLNYMRKRKKPIVELIPSYPESDDAYTSLIGVFHRINNHLAKVFNPALAIPVFALVTLEWMRGLPLALIINKRLDYLNKKKQPFTLATVIRSTMKDIEEVARFKAPKYLSAYMDVLEIFLKESDKSHLFPKDLRFDLFLEFGVPTKTLLSLIGLGMSRTSAIAVNEYLASDALSEEEILRRLRLPEWSVVPVSVTIRREVDHLVRYRAALAS